MVVSGELIKSVVFKSPTVTVNDEGGREKTFSASITTKAKVVGVSQRRGEAALSVEKDFYIRWRADAEMITKDWLITYESEDYVINSIERENEESKFLKFRAKVKTNG